MKKIFLVLILLMTVLLLSSCSNDSTEESRAASYYIVEYLVENKINATQPYFINVKEFVGYIYYDDELLYDFKYTGDLSNWDSVVEYRIYNIIVSFENTEDTESYTVLIKYRPSRPKYNYRGVYRSSIKEIVILQEITG